jgi:dTDP-4-dehydrorhamnose reductase
MPHYVILGAGGQLGQELAARLPAEETACLTRQDADLAVPGQVTQLLSTLRPQIVYNCAAYNLVDKAEDEPQAAFAINANGVRELAIACRDLGATLVHFSTDYVFGLDTERHEPYRESDAPGPVSVYGLSKLAGEYFIRALCPNHFVFRTCGLYGRHGAGGKGGNFVETMLKLAVAGKTIRVVNDQVLTPTSAGDVATAAVASVERLPPGLYHLTNDGQCSWYEFAATIFRLAGVTADLHATTTEEYGSQARRPLFSVLTMAHSFGLRIRPWQEALADYLSQR